MRFGVQGWHAESFWDGRDGVESASMAMLGVACWPGRDSVCKGGARICARWSGGGQICKRGVFETVAGELRTPIGRVAGLSVPMYVRGGLCSTNLRKWGQFSGTMCLFLRRWADGQMGRWAAGRLGSWADEADGAMERWTAGQLDRWDR